MGYTCFSFTPHTYISLNQRRWICGLKSVKKMANRPTTANNDLTLHLLNVHLFGQRNSARPFEPPLKATVSLCPHCLTAGISQNTTVQPRPDPLFNRPGERRRFYSHTPTRCNKIVKFNATFNNSDECNESPRFVKANHSDVDKERNLHATPTLSLFSTRINVKIDLLRARKHRMHFLGEGLVWDLSYDLNGDLAKYQRRIR